MLLTDKELLSLLCFLDSIVTSAGNISRLLNGTPEIIKVRL